jgi:hypothetical protein
MKSRRMTEVQIPEGKKPLGNFDVKRKKKD